MQTKIDQRVHAYAPQEELSLRQPSRLGWRLTLGVIIEGVTLVVVMVTLATHQFSIITCILAVLGILIPLLLLTWGFRLLTKDEIHSRQEMRRGKRAWPIPLYRKSSGLCLSPVNRLTSTHKGIGACVRNRSGMTL
jgi:hypothetical protein